MLGGCCLRSLRLQNRPTLTAPHLFQYAECVAVHRFLRLTDSGRFHGGALGLVGLFSSERQCVLIEKWTRSQDACVQLQTCKSSKPMPARKPQASESHLKTESSGLDDLGVLLL